MSLTHNPFPEGRSHEELDPSRSCRHPRGGCHRECVWGGGGSSISDNGTLRLALTDAPACGYDHVYVTVQKVRVHKSASAGDNDAGWSEVVLNPAQRIDLLSLTNGVLADLGQTPLPAGSLHADAPGAGAPTTPAIRWRTRSCRPAAARPR